MAQFMASVSQKTEQGGGLTAFWKGSYASLHLAQAGHLYGSSHPKSEHMSCSQKEKDRKKYAFS